MLIWFWRMRLCILIIHNFLSFLLIMNCFVWNCRGPSNPTFLRHLQNYFNVYKPSCMALMETKCNSVRADVVFSKIGFSKYVCQDGIGRGGGIWFAWDPNLINVLSFTTHPQFINLQIETNSIVWWLTIVYASPQQDTRDALWRDISDIAPPEDAPWALIGDFIEIVDSTEKSGGAPYDPSRGRAFKD